MGSLTPWIFIHGTHSSTSSFNQERLWGAQLQVPSAAHPGSCSSGQAKAAQHPGILPDTTHKLPLVGKYNGREPGRGINTLAIISHAEIESWCNWNMYVDLGSHLDPTAVDESRHNSSPLSSTSPLNLLCSFGDCPKKSPDRKPNLQVTSVFLTAFIQWCFCSLKKSKSFALLFPVSCKTDQGRTVM